MLIKLICSIHIFIAWHALQQNMRFVVVFNLLCCYEKPFVVYKNWKTFYIRECVFVTSNFTSDQWIDKPRVLPPYLLIYIIVFLSVCHFFYKYKFRTCTASRKKFNCLNIDNYSWSETAQKIVGPLLNVAVCPTWECTTLNDWNSEPKGRN